MLYITYHLLSRIILNLFQRVSDQSWKNVLKYANSCKHKLHQQRVPHINYFYDVMIDSVQASKTINWLLNWLALNLNWSRNHLILMSVVKVFELIKQQWILINCYVKQQFNYRNTCYLSLSKPIKKGCSVFNHSFVHESFSYLFAHVKW